MLRLGLHLHRLGASPAPGTTQRFASSMAPRRTQYRKAHKGRPPCPLGQSTAGTTLVHGEYGLKLLHPARVTAAQLTCIVTTIKRKLRASAKGAAPSGSGGRNLGGSVWLRVFPDRPVTRKGNEVRMGKGKGAFEYWATWVGPGRVLVEVGGIGLRKEVAQEAIRLARDKCGWRTAFVAKEEAKVVKAMDASASGLQDLNGVVAAS